MRPVTAVSHVPQLADRSSAPAERGGRAVVGTPAVGRGSTLWVRETARGSATPGRGSYAELAYAAAGPPARAAHDEVVELSVRHVAGGGRLTVARRTAGGRTTGIEAQVG